MPVAEGAWMTDEKGASRRVSERVRPMENAETAGMRGDDDI
jgi:hypothetical protein